MRTLILTLSLTLILMPGPAPAQNSTQGIDLADVPEATKLVEDIWDYMRGKTSVSTTKMVIHRPDWEREVVIKGWTKDVDLSLFVTLAPAKDKGNGTLKKGREMWTFNPKVNRVIKIPPSMMSQAWMGSDFSNNDLAKSDSILIDYDHKVIDVQEQDGVPVYTVEAIPKPGAPVVWGMVRLTLRQDLILLGQEFFDEDMEPVKSLVCTDLKMLGDRLFPATWKMSKADAQDEYTLVLYDEVVFDQELPDSLFTRQALKNPPR